MISVSSCKCATYCSRECQAADWKAQHKKQCYGEDEEGEGEEKVDC